MTSRNPTSAYSKRRRPARFSAAAAVLVAVTAAAPAAHAAAPDAAVPSGAASAASAGMDGGAPRRRLAPVAGALTILLPLAVGSVLWSHDDRPDLQRQGVYVAAAGMAAAPFIAEGMNRRWSRAAAFGVATLLTSAGACVSLAFKDPFRTASTKQEIPFVAMFSVSLFAAAASVLDSAIGGADTR